MGAIGVAIAGIGRNSTSYSVAATYGADNRTPFSKCISHLSVRVFDFNKIFVERQNVGLRSIRRAQSVGGAP
jgi:hypothetical protein